MPEFTEDFRQSFSELLRWRRDVRRFRTDPIDELILAEVLRDACLAPSVGNSQPWRFVRVSDPGRRELVRESFSRCNARAAVGYSGEQAALYASLKLEGLTTAPEQIAIFVVPGTEVGAGLGRQTMPETITYSAVMAIHALWLSARARGIGIGWVSILEPDEIRAALDVPEDWRLIAYLCVGLPDAESQMPELERQGWQGRLPASEQIIER